MAGNNAGTIRTHRMRHCPRCGTKFCNEAYKRRQCLVCGYLLATKDESANQENGASQKAAPVLTKKATRKTATRVNSNDFVQSMPEQMDDWLRVFYRDFTAKNTDLSALSFCCYPDMDRNCDPFPAGPDGLLLKGRGMLWIDDLEMPTDVMVVLTVNWPERTEGLEILINTVRQQQYFNHFPPGYGCQFAGYGGKINFITRLETAGFGHSDNGIGARFSPQRTYSLALEHDGERISQYVNDEPILSRIEPLPLSKHAGGRIAVRAWGDVEIKAVAVYRKYGHEKANPFAKADEIFLGEDFNRAAGMYLAVADENHSRDIKEQALIKAYLAACRTDDAPSLKQRINAKIMSDFPSSPYILTMMEADAANLWKTRQFGQALDIADKIFERDPQTRIIPEILELPRTVLDPQVANRLLKLLARTQDIVRVDLSFLGLTDLSPISNLPLVRLRCSDNELTSFEPLTGMPLNELIASKNNIRNLTPLKKMKLEKLEVADNRLSSLEDLRGIHLKYLNCGNNPIGSLEPLKGMRLTKLLCSHTHVEDLSPLHDMPLEQLTINYANVAGLGPLSETPLIELNCSHNRISSLKGLPRSLKSLDCGYNNIADLEPLRGMNLNLLICAANHIQALDPLRGMEIEELNCSGTRINSLAPLEGMPLKEFRCQSTGITTLKPIGSCPLQSLICRDNRLTSLEPFDDKLPENFQFTPSMLPSQYFEKLMAKWATRPELRKKIKHLKIDRAFDLGDASQLRELAEVFQGRRYVYIGRNVSWSEANDKAEKLGGHLLSITSPEENAFAFSLFSEFRSSSWLGLKIEPGGKETWTTREPATFMNFTENRRKDIRKPTLMSFKFAGKWSSVFNDKHEAPFIIEWTD